MVPFLGHGMVPTLCSVRKNSRNGTVPFFCSVGSRIEEWNGTVLAQLTSLLYTGEHTSRL
jgi:hypothetical protein